MRILLTCTPDDVEKEVKRRIEDFSTNGDLVFGPVQNTPSNIPLKNIVRMYETAMK